MTTPRLFTRAALAALIVVVFGSPPLPAQQRDRRSRDSDRDSRQETTQPASTQPGSPEPRSSRQAYSDRYAVLEQRNIFVKDRARATTRGSGGSSSSTQPTRRSVEESLVLRGIAMEELGYRAYLEDLNNDSATLKVSPGDKLALGRVTVIALDAIGYEHDGAQKWIEIGSDLTGKLSAIASPYASAASGTPSTGPTSLPANLDPNDPSLTVEQRMRIRRLQLEQRR